MYSLCNVFCVHDIYEYEYSRFVCISLLLLLLLLLLSVTVSCCVTVFYFLFFFNRFVASFAAAAAAEMVLLTGSCKNFSRRTPSTPPTRSTSSASRTGGTTRRRSRTGFGRGTSEEAFTLYVADRVAPHVLYTYGSFFFCFVLRRVGKNKAQARHASTFQICVVCQFSSSLALHQQIRVAATSVAFYVDPT